jgi:hypothetical protein
MRDGAAARKVNQSRELSAMPDVVTEQCWRSGSSATHPVCHFVAWIDICSRGRTSGSSLLRYYDATKWSMALLISGADISRLSRYPVREIRPNPVGFLITATPLFLTKHAINAVQFVCAAVLLNEKNEESRDCEH